MAQFKGTPGPWVDGSTFSRRYDIIGKDGRIVTQIEPNDKTDDFNFMLIAAAPELLEALQNLMLSYSDFRERTGRNGDPQNPLILAALAAINKATGETK